jgi:hypothetical protein
VPERLRDERDRAPRRSHGWRRRAVALAPAGELRELVGVGAAGALARGGALGLADELGGRTSASPWDLVVAGLHSLLVCIGRSSPGGRATHS